MWCVCARIKCSAQTILIHACRVIPIRPHSASISRRSARGKSIFTRCLATNVLVKWAEISSPRSARSAMSSISSICFGLPGFAFIGLALLSSGMPCGHDPQIFSDSIPAVFNDERDQASLPKTDDPILFGIITPLVFNIRKTQHLVQDGKVNLPSLPYLLSFRFIPAYTHRRLQPCLDISCCL